MRYFKKNRLFLTTLTPPVSPSTPVALHRAVSRIQRRTRRDETRRDKCWGDACALAGVSGLLFHDLRRSAVRNMKRAGVQDEVSMRIARSIFERYNIIDDSDLQDAGEKLESYARERKTSSRPALEGEVAIKANHKTYEELRMNAPQAAVKYPDDVSDRMRVAIDRIAKAYGRHRMSMRELEMLMWGLVRYYAARRPE